MASVGTEVKMDLSAIFAGIAALVSVIAFAYSVRQHKDNIRKEFILWALEQMQSPAQRETRRLLWYLSRKENEKKKKKIIDGIKKSDLKILYSEEYAKIRGAFALFSQIGYFWSKAGYGNMKDVQALFPQIPDTWNISQPYIEAIRSRPNQSDSFKNFEELASRIKKGK